MAISKLCFVTVGATASFEDLIKAVLSETFLSALQKSGYTKLLVQYGKGGKTIYDKATVEAKASSKQITIDGFELDSGGLGKYLREVKGNLPGANASEGVVISHAGEYGHIGSDVR